MVTCTWGAINVFSRTHARTQKCTQVRWYSGCIRVLLNLFWWFSLVSSCLEQLYIYIASVFFFPLIPCKMGPHHLICSAFLTSPSIAIGDHSSPLSVVHSCSFETFTPLVFTNQWVICIHIFIWFIIIFCWNQLVCIHSPLLINVRRRVVLPPSLRYLKTTGVCICVYDSHSDRGKTILAVMLFH